MQERNHIILKVDHLSMRFGGLMAISDLSFEIQRNKISALIGPNGAGKTTAFNCITGFYKPTTGRIALTRRDGTRHLLERFSGHEISKKGKVARTFQNIRLFTGMTVLENILVAQHNSLMKSWPFRFKNIFSRGNNKKTMDQSMEKAEFWLEKVNLIERANDRAGDLPYGDQRRLEIIRAMCTEPELLCLDEPAAGLNPKESLELNILLDEIRMTGTSILLIEHDMSVVMGISDHIIVLEYGHKISEGDPDFIRNDPHVIAAYLGVEDQEDESNSIESDESFDAKPNGAQGSGFSASMMAGPISSTIGHSDPRGEVIKISNLASKSSLVDNILKKETQKLKTLNKTSLASNEKSPPRKKVQTTDIIFSNSLQNSPDQEKEDLLLIKGLGPASKKKLYEQGIFHFRQIANWKKTDILLAEKLLGTKGGITKENWPQQAQTIINAKKKETSARKRRAE